MTYDETCWRNTWLSWARTYDFRNQRAFVKFKDPDDEWFQQKNYFFITNFQGSREKWAAARTHGIKSGELEKWLSKRELGIVTPRSGSQKISKTRINKYPYYWPIAEDIAVTTYTHKTIIDCPCCVKNGWICSRTKCKYEKRIFLNMKLNK